MGLAGAAKEGGEVNPADWYRALDQLGQSFARARDLVFPESWQSTPDETRRSELSSKLKAMLAEVEK